LPPTDALGAAGLAGVVGLEGADGVTGVAGLEGAAGVAGVEGAAGVTGLAGVEVEGLACGPLPPPLLHAVTANKAAQTNAVVFIVLFINSYP
jgi:UPI00017B5A63 related cluster